MKKLPYIITLLLLATLFLSAQFLHETHITIISPKVSDSYKTGQNVDIHFKLNCGEKLKLVEYNITDQDNKVLFSKKPNVAGKNAIEEQMVWKIANTDPSVFTLSINATDVDGHSSSKLVQFNANF